MWVPVVPSLEIVVLVAFASGLWAGVGAVIGAHRPGRERVVLGWALATAAGLMLGLAYLLSAVGADYSPPGVALGSALGIAAIFALHRLFGVGEMERLGEAPAGGAGRGRVLGVSLLHDAAEGLALGTALHVDLWLGLATALTLAVHNVAEGGSLATVLVRRGASPRRAVAMAQAVNFSSVVTAPLALTTAGVLPASLPVLLGVAIGALIYLVLVDLLPEAYERAGQAAVALLVSAGLALVVALGGWL